MAVLRKHMCLMCKVERSMSLISGMQNNCHTVCLQWVNGGRDRMRRAPILCVNVC